MHINPIPGIVQGALFRSSLREVNARYNNLPRISYVCIYHYRIWHWKISVYFLMGRIPSDVPSLIAGIGGFSPINISRTKEVVAYRPDWPSACYRIRTSKYLLGTLHSQIYTKSHTNTYNLVELWLLTNIVPILYIYSINTIQSIQLV